MRHDSSSATVLFVGGQRLVMVESWWLWWCGVFYGHLALCVGKKRLQLRLVNYGAGSVETDSMRLCLSRHKPQTRPVSASVGAVVADLEADLRTCRCLLRRRARRELA